MSELVIWLSILIAGGMFLVSLQEYWTLWLINVYDVTKRTAVAVRERSDQVLLPAGQVQRCIELDPEHIGIRLHHSSASSCDDTANYVI